MAFKPKPDNKPDSTPDVVGEISGGAVDRSHDLSLKIAGIERSVTYLEGTGNDIRGDLRSQSVQLSEISRQLVRLDSIDKRLESAEPKIQQLQMDVSSAKTGFWVAIGIITFLGSIVGTVLTIFLNKILDALVKHFGH